jgi:hypothetical protein
VFEYERKQAPHEKAIIQNCLKSGRPYPKKIRDAPDLEPDNAFYYFAFSHLDTCRSFELGPIPYTVIRDYAFEYELDEEQIERFFDIIAQVDLWLREEIRKDIKTAMDNG